MKPDQLATDALNIFREEGVLRVEGERRGAKWVFTDAWAA